MPTYEYECKKCRHRFEAFQSITAGALRKCPECGRMQLRRLIGAGAGIIFKGSGFYVTDYKRGSSRGKPAPRATEPSASSGEGGSDSKASKKDSSEG